MIYTLTCNPALDYVIQVPTFTEGIVNRTAGEALFPGGKGINVSTVLKNLGTPSVALGFTAGFTGAMLTQMLKEQGIESDFICLSEGFSRINVKIKGEKETEINGQGPEIDDAALKALYAKLDKLQNGDVLVLAGSIPSSMPDTLYCDILQQLSAKTLDFVVDATGSLLTNTLTFRPFLIKPNLAELEEIFNQNLTNDEDILRCAKELSARGARNVLVSLGADGALLLTEDGQVLRQNAPKGKVVNTTGSGDSMVAGFLAGYTKTQDYAFSLTLGICAGSAGAFSQNLPTEEEIQNLFSVHTI